MMTGLRTNSGKKQRNLKLDVNINMSAQPVVNITWPLTKRATVIQHHVMI